MITILKQIKYSLDDILDNGFQYGILFIQIFVSLILFSFITSKLLGYSEFISNIEKFNSKNNYILRDVTNDEKFLSIISNENSESNIEIIYEHLNKNYTVCSFNSVDIRNLDNEFPSDIMGNGQRGLYEALYINNIFSSFFNLVVENGELFSNNDFINSSGRIPVILGNKYSSFYKPGDNLGDKYIVKGILKKSCFYFDLLTRGDEVLYLDEAILIPINIDMLNSYADYDMLLFGSYILDTNINELKNIQELSLSLNMIDFEFKQFDNQINNLLKNSLLEIQFYIILFSIILVFCVVGMICCLFEYLSQYMREFTIHIMCGADSIRLAFRIFFQVASIIILSNIILFIINGLSTENLLTLVFSLFITLVITILPIIKLYKTNFNVQIKRSQ